MYTLTVDYNTTPHTPLQFAGMPQLVDYMKLARPLDWKIEWNNNLMFICHEGFVAYMGEEPVFKFQMAEDLAELTDAMHGKGYYAGVPPKEEIQVVTCEIDESEVPQSILSEKPLEVFPKKSLLDKVADSITMTPDFYGKSYQRNNRIVCGVVLLNVLTDKSSSAGEKVGAASMFAASFISPLASSAVSTVLIAEGLRHRGLMGSFKKSVSIRSMVVSALGIAILHLP